LGPEVDVLNEDVRIDDCEEVGSDGSSRDFRMIAEFELRGEGNSMVNAEHDDGDEVGETVDGEHVRKAFGYAGAGLVKGQEVIDRGGGFHFFKFCFTRFGGDFGNAGGNVKLGGGHCC